MAFKNAHHHGERAMEKNPDNNNIDTTLFANVFQVFFNFGVGKSMMYIKYYVRKMDFRDENVLKWGL